MAGRVLTRAIPVFNSFKLFGLTMFVFCMISFLVNILFITRRLLFADCTLTRLICIYTEFFLGGYSRDMFRASQPSQTITITTKEPNKNIRQNNQFKGQFRLINNVKNVTMARNQFINTYLTFAYEMRTGLESRIFWRYVILLLYSIDKIAGVTSNDEKNVRLFQVVSTMKGVVSDQEQQYWSNTFINLIHKINTINSTTTRSMYNRLPIK